MLREMFGAVDCDVVGDSIVVSTVTLEVLMVWCMVWSRKMFQEIGNIPTEAGAGPTMVREQMLVLVLKVKVLQVLEAEHASPHSLTSSTVSSDHSRLLWVLSGISWAM